MSAPIIEAIELTKYYGKFCALDRMSFQIQRGEVVGLLGPNGAGKTTTLRLLTGFMPPSSGTVCIGGYDIFEQALQAKRLIGYLPEHPPLYPDLTVRESLRFHAELHDVSASGRQSAIEWALEQTSLTNVQQQLVGQLSRGFQQRLGLAQVLVKDPSVLILDEPTIGLDPKQIAEVRSLIKGLAGQYTIIFSSHILQEVSALCERVMIINQGRLIAEDLQENLLRPNTGEEHVHLVLRGASLQEVLKCLAQFNGIEIIEHEEGGEVLRIRVKIGAVPNFYQHYFNLLKEKGWIPLEISPVRSSLEETFLQLTAQKKS